MGSQEIMLGARVWHVRELKAEIARLKEANARLRDENSELKSHFDLALLAAEDLRDLSADGKLLLVDGWNLVLGADRVAASREGLLTRVRARLGARTSDRAWVVFDGPRENVSCGDRLRVSYTGGGGAHRADRLICDFIRMARFRGDAARIEVVTDDRDFAREASRLGAAVRDGREFLR